MRKFMSHDFPTKSSALSKFTTSFGVFFKVPDQGMTEYNILARYTIQFGSMNFAVLQI